MRTYCIFMLVIVSLLNVHIAIRCNSISQNSRYPEFCLLAAQNESVFQTFRSHPAYREIVETCGGFEYGIFFLHEITTKFPQLLAYLPQICLEDAIGGPIAFHYPQIGTVSPTVLRYVKIVGDLQREFGDLNDLDMVEIGGGFGGQCKMINDITKFKSYTIIDLPECTPLIKKYLSCFSIANTQTIDCNATLTPKKYDLIISNYAFSEIERSEQMQYFKAIINLAPRGYIIYNHFPSVNPLTIHEFVQLLEKNGKKVRVIHENPGMIGDIIIWHS